MFTENKHQGDDDMFVFKVGDHYPVITFSSSVITALVPLNNFNDLKTTGVIKIILMWITQNIKCRILVQ